ncbi:MAG: hypothetical protein NTV54_00130 [Ignavibacteriales bacterium]|nr:hypothetical protein [Ignavibacteriales bacterium]
MNENNLNSKELPNTSMELVHAGIDYRRQMDESYDLLRQPFGLPSRSFLLPFNPATSCTAQPVRIAFFGYNAYCNDTDYSKAQQKENFIVWCQEHYNRKLFRVMSLWQEGLSPKYTSGGSIYYTNFIKLVLRERLFKKAPEVETVLNNNRECAAFFENIADAELRRLKQEGCKVFIIFGLAAYRGMQQIAEKADVRLIHERHFSYYSIKNTERLIKENIDMI